MELGIYIYGLLSSFCIPNAACCEALGCHRVRRLFPCMSGESLVSVHHHLLPSVDMVSRRLALVLCAFGNVQQRSSSAKHCGDQTERNKSLPRNRHADDDQNTLAVKAGITTVFGIVYINSEKNNKATGNASTEAPISNPSNAFLPILVPMF